MAIPAPADSTDPPLVPPSPARPGTSLANGFLFGIPLGELGWFASLLISLAAGFAAFFAATFLGIAGLLVAGTLLHRTVDYTVSYRLIGLPTGLLVLALASTLLGTLWLKRILRRA